MSVRSRQIAVAGAGIAGLAVAIALSRKGFPVRVYERSAELGEVGAGLQLSPNATRILARMDLLGEIRRVSARPRAIILRSARSLRELARIPLGAAADDRWGAPYLTVHRADLHAILANAASREPNVELVTGASVRDVAFHRYGVTLSVDRGGRIDEFGCRIVVAADGVWSALRETVVRRGAARFTGQIAWRGTVPVDAVDEAIRSTLLPGDCVTALLHPRFHLVAYPVRAGRALNLVAITRGPEIAEGWAEKVDRGVLDEAVRTAAEPLRRLVGAFSSWTAWPIHAVDPGVPWVHPAGFAMIGDAAHAMTPHAAQGAALALEDASVLAAELARTPGDLPTAFARYEKARRRRVRRVASRGRFNRFAWHAAGPIGLGRDIVLKLRGPTSLAADLDWLYGWDGEDLP